MDSRRRPFKIGLFVPHFEQPWNGAGLSWADIAAMARRAEEVGFDSFWLPDHLLYRFPQVHQQGAWDAWSLLAALAATTRTLEIGPLVACSSFRNPALIAKMADTIDEISGGRLILGLGAGWHEPEYAAFGFPYDHRVSRFEEALQIITALLRTGQVDFQGAYYSARDCELRPRGPRPEGLPILVGGSGERMLRLAARYADAWNADRQNDVAAVQALNARVDQACQDEGRDPASLSRVIGIQVDLLNGVPATDATAAVGHGAVATHRHARGAGRPDSSLCRGPRRAHDGLDRSRLPRRHRGIRPGARGARSRRMSARRQTLFAVAPLLSPVPLPPRAGYWVPGALWVSRGGGWD